MNLRVEDDGIWSRIRAEEDVRDARVKNELITKLKANGLLSDKQMDQFEREFVRREDKKQSLQSTRQRQLEMNKKYKMSLYHFIPRVVEHIVNHAPKDCCVQIYEDVVSVIPSHSKGSATDAVSLHETPETPFSVCRTSRRGSAKSNAELIDILASTANLENQEAVSIRGQITFADSIDASGTSGILNLKAGLVSGGRLGRDHMLADVPNHYVRDRLMNYILTMLDEDRREEAQKAVFSDLSAAELEQYSAIIWQKQRDMELEEQAEWDKARRAIIKREAQEATIAANLERQDTLINEINNRNIDLTPKPGFAVRDYYKVYPISGSVVKPGIDKPGLNGAAGMVPEERDVEVGYDIDRDCDQIRAMIARFLKESEWSGNQFRWVLDHTTRPQLNTFLEKTGPSAGKQSKIFPLAWEFFKKREMLGYSLTNTPNDAGVLRERDGNRRKRPCAGGKENTRGKRTRRT